MTLLCLWLGNSSDHEERYSSRFCLFHRVHTGAYDVISFQNGYHGASIGTQPLCGIGSWKFQLPSSFGVHKATLPDPYGGRVGGRYCRDTPAPCTRQCDCLSAQQCVATDYYIDELQTLFDTSMPKKVAGFFAESIQGVGGVIQYPVGYLKKAQEMGEFYDEE